MAEGKVDLSSAEIGGQLGCSGGTFKNPDGIALAGHGLVAKGDLYLDDGFVAEGEVGLLGAEIGGHIGCRDGTFKNPNGNALNGQNLVAKGGVFLMEGFTAEGKVDLSSAEIGGQLGCSGGTFKNPDGDALFLQEATIDGSLFLAGLKSFVGGLDLHHARVGTLMDAADSWPSAGKLWLRGFVYDAFGPGSPDDSKSRIDWLRRQSKEPFSTQPYEQLAKVFRAMGHEADARKVAIAKQQDLRRYGDLGWLSKAWNWFVGFTLAHGYQPWRVLIPGIALVLLGWLVFGIAAGKGSMQQINTGRLQMSDGGQVEVLFHPFVYSLDVFTPLVELGQDTFWYPDAKGNRPPNTKGVGYPDAISEGYPDAKSGWGVAAQIYRWFEIVLGWAITTLFVLGFTSAVKKE